jgi:hypothetical protein
LAREPDIPKDDVERALKVSEIERENWPKYKQPSSLGSYLVLILALAIAGVTVYYALNHKEKVSRLWYRATHWGAVPAQVQPDQ